MLTDQLMRTAALSSQYLDAVSRKTVIRFVKSQWNRDGGVHGRDGRSDLYYTVFGALCMKALKGPVPVVRLFRFLRSFETGRGLDDMHLFGLIGLRSYFPMTGKTKRGLTESVKQLGPGTAYDSFFKRMMSECLGLEDQADGPVHVSSSDPTTTIAAAITVNQQPDPALQAVLLERYCKSGGFCISDDIKVPDLLSTATALFALKTIGFEMGPIRSSSFEFIELLWRDSGGFAGHEADQFEDVEYTYYALLSIGCLMA